MSEPEKKNDEAHETAALLDKEKAELAELNRKIAASRDRMNASAERRRLREKRLEAENADREAHEAEVIEELEREHGPLGKVIARYDTPDGMLVVKRQQQIIFHRFRNSKCKESDVQAIVDACGIYPERERFNELLEKYPGALYPLANVITDLYGMKTKEDVGKA